MRNIILVSLLVFSLVAYSNTELPEEGTNGTQDTSKIFVNNGCGC